MPGKQMSGKQKDIRAILRDGARCGLGTSWISLSLLNEFGAVTVEPDPSLLDFSCGRRGPKHIIKCRPSIAVLVERAIVIKAATKTFSAVILDSTEWPIGPIFNKNLGDRVHTPFCTFSDVVNAVCDQI